MMKKILKIIAVFCLSIMANGFFGTQLKAQTVTTTITYTGFQACGGCTVCGADYWCFNTPGSYCGNTAACGTKTFNDPVPPGNIVTNISISYFSAQCKGNSLTATINGVAFPTVNEGNSGCPCSSQPCGTSATSGKVFPCGVANYTYGGVNSLQLCTGNSVCINRLVLTITYQPANQSTPAIQPGAITGNTSACVGVPQTFSVPGVSNANSYTWTVPAGWTINSGQGTTTITATPGSSPSSGNVCVSAKNLCGTSTPSCLAVTMAPLITPTFTNPGPICSGTSFTLPTTSNNGISGTWSPAVNTTATTNYFFTSSTGSCAANASMQVVVTPKPTPTFTNPGPICFGATFTLPLSSNEGISGTWSPAVNNTNTTTYTFTPSGTACAVPATMQVVVNAKITPTFTNPGPICSGATLTLPTTSNNSVTGTWSPAVDNTATTTYTFTPSGAACAVPTDMKVSVNPLPTATISGTADVCQNGTAPTVTFTGANGTQPYTFTYTVNGGSNQTVVSTGTTATLPAPTTTAGTFTYTLVSIQDASPTTCSNPQTGTATVIVKPKPVVTLNTSNSTICSGSGVTITPSSVPTGAAFSWTVQNVNTTGANNGSGTVIADNLSTTGTTAGTTTYTVTGTLNGCVSDPVNSAITVNTVPVASAQNQTICSGATTSINLTANIPNTTFAWTTVASGVTGASNGTGTQINQTLFSLTGGTVTYTVTPTVGTCSGIPIDVLVTVNATPTIVATPSNSDVCAGASVTLAATGAFTYTWSPAAGLSSTTGSSVFASPTATTTYTVTGTNANGCIGTSQATVVVRPYPVLTVSPDTVICLGETTPLVATGATTYAWTPAIGLDQTTGSTVLASPSAPTTYIVTGTSNGCSTIDSIKVGTNSLPTVNAGGDQTVCKGVPVILTATGTLTYVWSDNVVNGVPFVTDTTRTYTVTGIDANGCKNIDYVTITTIDAPAIAFTVDTTLGCAPLHVQFTNTTEGATNYLWDFGDGQTSTAKNAYHDYYIEGCHDVTLTADNGLGCTMSIAMDDYICVLPSPIAAFTATTYDITNVVNEVYFNNQSQNAISYEWNFGIGEGYSNVKNPTHAFGTDPIRNNAVVLVATNDEGCTDTARTVIHMTEDVVFFVPNSFTPDGDEYNNIFKPVFLEEYYGAEYTMMIFDRWGEVVFETHNLAYGWDGTYQTGGGKICQDGVYSWKIIVRKKGMDERITKTGHITLIR